MGKLRAKRSAFSARSAPVTIRVVNHGAQMTEPTRAPLVRGKGSHSEAMCNINEGKPYSWPRRLGYAIVSQQDKRNENERSHLHLFSRVLQRAERNPLNRSGRGGTWQ